MRILRWSPLGALLLLGSLACFGFGEEGGSGAGSGAGVGAGVGSRTAPPPSPLMNPQGQLIVDTLVQRSHSRAFFPLSEGIELAYEELESRGDGDRLLFMTDKPAGSEVRGVWRFTVTGVDRIVDPPVFTATLQKPSPPPETIEEADPRTPVTVDLRLWVEGERVKVEGPFGIRDAVEVAPGPPVAASEVVPCTLWILDGIQTDCRAIGGTGGTSLGEDVVYLGRDNDLGNAVGRTLIGIVSLGTIIPGSKRRVWTLRRTASIGIEPERQIPAYYKAWSDAMPKGESVDVMHRLAESHAPDASSLAAIVASDPVHLEARALAAMQLLPAGHRAPVLRRAIGTVPSEAPRTRMLLVSRLDAAVSSVPETHQPSIVALFSEDERAVAKAVASGACPSLESALREPESSPWDAAVKQHMGPHLAQPDCDRSAELAANVLGSRMEVLDQILAAQDPDRWLPRFKAALQETSMEERTALLARHEQRLSSLPETERRALLDLIDFDAEEARQLLDLPPEP